MDTVSMLNTMRFYCQPILPLVYDESMSYYETLCKVVGQLNTTGETVNKLNEGLTGEISDRQAADAALDARIKEIEETNGKLHFLKFDGANPSGAMPTRSELYNWVRNGDAIYTLFSTNETGRGQVYAASCTYNAGNWGSEASNDFNIIVPIETRYDSVNDYAISQKIAKLTIPSASQSSLNSPWGLEIIEINTPSTSAEGVVNVVAVVSDSGSVNCSITPSEFLQLYNMTRGGKNLCVAVNAKLAYDGLARSSSIATVDTNNRIVRIAFERDSGTAITNGVNQLTKTLDYLIGDAKTGTWVHETIDSKIFDFNRYEGFQFTRGANNVITTDAESTPSAVYSYYGGQSGKLYQNLPTRLIDEIDNAEYWNGVFDSYTDGHITFTFITANYATIGETMVVRVIELSATKAGSVWTGGEKWSYAAKEFEVPYRPTSYVLDVWQASDTPTVVNGYVSYDGASSLDFDDLLPLVEGHQEILATLHKGTSSTGLEWSGLAYSSKLVNDGVGSITFATLEGVALGNGIPSMHGIVVFSKDSRGVKKVVITFSSALPAPNPDGSDNGKVPTVDGTSWALKTPTGGGSSDAVLYTPQTLTDEQKKQARENVGAWEAYNGAVPVVCEYEKYIPAGERATKTLIVTSGQLNPPPLDSASANVLTAWNYLMNTGTVFSPVRPKGAQTLVKHIATLVNAGIFGDSFMATQGNMFEANTEFYKNGNNISIEAHTDKKLIAVRCTYPENGIYFALYYYLETETFDDSAVFNSALTSSSLKSSDTVLTFPQQTMAAAPDADMQIATKKYVDDGLQDKLSTRGGEISASLEVGQTVSAGGAVSVGRTSEDTGIHFEKAASDAGRVSHGSDAMSGVAPIARLKVASPTEDDDATTKEYVDGRAVRYDEAQTLTEAQQIQACKNIGAVGNNSPQFKGYVTLTPANETIGHGVGLSPSGSGYDYTLDISEVDQQSPTKLVGVKTPTDTDTNAAATVEFVLNKIKKAVSIDVEEEEVKTYNYTDIDSEITNGAGNVWLSLGTGQLRMVAWNKTGASSYVLTFVNLESTNFNIHTVTVSPSAATYTYITK